MQAVQTIRYRLATEADIDAIFRVHQSSVKQLCEQQYSAQQIAMWLEGRHSGVYLDAIHKATLWVADGDEIMGFVETDGNEVNKLFVAGNHAFRGIGDELLQIGLAHIAATGAPIAYLESTVTAVEFYERNGFSVVGTGFFSRGNSPVQLEVIKMERTFA